MAAQLDGIWAFDTDQVLDDRAAIAAGNIDQKGRAAPHGTWTRIRYYTMRMENDGGLTIFDDEGAIARFAKASSANTWTSTVDPASYPVPRSKRSTIITPSLVLARYGADAPPNAHPGDLFVRRTLGGSNEVATGQRLVYSATPDTFDWSSDQMPGRRLTFSRIAPQTGDPTNPRFGDPFVAQSVYAQTDFPYYGFDPRHVDLYAPSGVTMTGTSRTASANASQLGEGFIAPLVFAFPTADSKDYVRFSVLSEQVNLPIGRTAIPLGEKTETRNSHMLSSVSDRMDSWSVTLGLSAGVPELLSVELEGTYAEKVEEHQENQSRYAVSRSVTRTWVNLMDAPSLRLDDSFVAWLKQAVHALLSGEDPNWESFTKHFGTHYVHAMTQGTITYAETRMSLTSESHAASTDIDASVSISGAFEGISAGMKADYKQAWSQKLGTTLEDEDVTMFSFGEGTPTGLGIFYDLRPLSELLSPVFLPYSGVDDWGQLAPLVWTDLRESFNGYLAILGYGGAVAENLKKDYTPRVIRFSIYRLTPWIVDGAGNSVGFIGSLSGGALRFEKLDGGTKGDREHQAVIRAKDYSPSVQVTGGHVLPSQDEGYGLVAVRPGVAPSFVLHADGLTARGVPRGNQLLDFKMNGSVPLELSLDGFGSTREYELDMPFTGTANGFTARVAVEVRVEDLGPISDQSFKSIAAGQEG